MSLVSPHALGGSRSLAMALAMVAILAMPAIIPIIGFIIMGDGLGRLS